MRVVAGVDLNAAEAHRPKPKKRKTLSVDQHVEGVLNRDRSILGKTFSLVESTSEKHRAKANDVLHRLMPHSGQSIRLGITGIPGVGKSTFIEALGLSLIESGHRVAVHAVDPSSERTGGSILGDKTRMEKLSRHEDALIRPSASGSSLGGVARGTRESILISEAAGYDVVIVETVGVGQSETQVAHLVDFFLLLMITGAGDEIQGIKRGIIEVADAIAINKADGPNKEKAEIARASMQSTLGLLKPSLEGWKTKVVTCSAVENQGIEDIWSLVEKYIELSKKTQQFEQKRHDQLVYWMKQTIENLLIENFYNDSGIQENLVKQEELISEGTLSPFIAASELVNTYLKGKAGQ